MEGPIRRLSFASSGKDIQRLVTLDLIVRAAHAAKRTRLADPKGVRQHRLMSSVSHVSATSASITLKSMSHHSTGVVTQAQRTERAQAQAFYLHRHTDGATSMRPVPADALPRVQPPARKSSLADARRDTPPKLTAETAQQATDAATEHDVRRVSEASAFVRGKQKREMIFKWLRGVVRPRTDGELPPMR